MAAAPKILGRPNTRQANSRAIYDEVVDIDDILDPALYRLAEFVSDYGKRHISQKFGAYEDLIWSLPSEWDDLIYYRNKFWNDFGYDNPFDDPKYWSFGDYRRRDIGFWWAFGAAKCHLLKLIHGYHQKTCMPIPRMQLRNHKSLETFNEYAIPVLEEYIELGILKIIPKSAARVILPMACIHKPEKTRIVVDGRPINMYTPAM